MEIERGGLFQEWNEDLRRRYIQILDLVIQTLKEIPYYPFTITTIDVLKLREAAKAMDIDVDDYDLTDRITFFEIRGLLIKEAVKKVEVYLKPGNPLEEKMNEAKQDYKDLYTEE